jgi:MoxR-like ATPase
MQPSTRSPSSSTPCERTSSAEIGPRTGSIGTSTAPPPCAAVLSRDVFRVPFSGFTSRLEAVMEKGMERRAEEFRTAVLAPAAARFPGRDELVEIIGLALCAADHLLLIGPPGTAKSELIADVSARIGGRFFEVLVTRFTEPTEIFGPIDLRKLRDGVVETRIEGMLPDADIAFLDEIFHGGSAILNTLLGILNDGRFRRGRDVVETPLHSVFAASNVAIDDPALRALQDRFTLRVDVRPLDENRLGDLLDAGWALERERSERRSGTTKPSERLFGMDELRALSNSVLDVDMAGARASLIELVRAIRRTGVFVSDRRVVKLQRLAASSAVLCGRSRAKTADLWPARYLWEHEDEVEPLAELVHGVIAESLDAEGTESIHPLAVRSPAPDDILADLSRLEIDVDRLATKPDGRAADELWNRVHEIDRLRRWCRAISTNDASVLERIRSRLGEIFATLDALAKEP